MDIVKFIQKSSLTKIKRSLPDVLQKISSHCDEIIGKGYMGEVKVSGVGSTIKIKIKNKIIEMPVVIKKSNFTGETHIDLIKGKLYISSTNDLTAEAIILYFISKLWYRKITPHILFMLGFGKCNPDNPQTYVDQIITEKQGLDHKIEIDNSGFVFLHAINFVPPVVETYMVTLWDLFRYMITYQDKHNMVMLPNKQKGNVIEILDGILISFLHTAYVLWNEYKLTLTDQHLNNIFIHWLNKDSYLGDENISQIKIRHKLYLVFDNR